MANLANRSYYIVRGKLSGALFVAWYENGQFHQTHHIHRDVPYNQDHIEVVKLLDLEVLANA